MRRSSLFGTTLKEAPGGSDAAGHQLLVRAAFLRQLGQGLFSYLTLGLRAMAKIEKILREEIEAIGGQELVMPVAQPADLWKMTGRWSAIGPELARFEDRRGRDMVLAMTHEEVVADLARSEIQSYRQLPQLVYQIQTKFRDDPRPRAGLIRVREFTMKDSYSLDRDEEGLDRQYRAHYQAYYNIFARCALPVRTVASDVGMMGGSLAHEFMYLTPLGEDTLVLCDSCAYSANRQVAEYAKPAAPLQDPLPLERVATPEATSIEAVASMLGVSTMTTAKALLMVADTESGQEFVCAMVRGDMDLNETKLANAICASALRPATEDECAKAGVIPGYASPIGMQQGLVVVDTAVVESPNLVVGANEEGFHFRNANASRDFPTAIVTDLSAARDGDACVNCGSALKTERAVEVGNIFKLGVKYSDAIGARFVDEDGTEKPIIMGSYGIGVGRLLACIAEEHHDESGLIWPVSVAPFHVNLVALSGSDDAILRRADELYGALVAAGVEVLYDDRDERAGVAFADADLIGLPLRVTLSRKSVAAGGAEMKIRGETETSIVPEADVVAAVIQQLRAMEDDIRSRVRPIPFS